MGDGNVEEELVSQFTHIPAEIPGVRMSAHVKPDTGAVEAPPVPTMSYLATAARANAGLARTTGVSQPTGVVSTGVVDLTDVNDDDDDDNSGTILVPKVEVEDIPTEEVNEEHKTAHTAQYGLPV